MHCQILSSGSDGNCLLVRAGELHLLVDAGLPPRQLAERFEAARMPRGAVEHILVTHAHLDHARSAGRLGRAHKAVVHCPEGMMRNRSVSRAPRLDRIRIGHRNEAAGAHGNRVSYTPVRIPHDCDPTVAYRVDYQGRRLVVLTDMGVPADEIVPDLAAAHVLVLEFNHDERMLASGPYSSELKKRVGGDRGHLSNAQASRVLERLAGEQLHTLILAHLSRYNNTPELAREAACATLERLGLSHVRVLVASQSEVGPNLKV